MGLWKHLNSGTDAEPNQLRLDIRSVNIVLSSTLSEVAFILPQLKSKFSDIHTKRFFYYTKISENFQPNTDLCIYLLVSSVFVFKINEFQARFPP